MRKRRDVFHYLRQKRFSIYCLQDTHFDPKLDKYISSEWGYTCFFSSYRSNSRGVAVMFSNNFEFKIKDVNRDENGNFIIISLSSMDKDLLLVNVYGPNKDDPNFYNELKEKIKNYQINDIIAVGDWNIAMDPDLDCQNYVKINNPKAREALEDMSVDLGLADVWRENNPDLRRYTWRKPTPLKQSRLDFFLLSDYLYWYFETADILPGYRSDHSMVTLKLKFGKNKKSNNYWKFNSSLLKDQRYAEEIKMEIADVVNEYAADKYDTSTIDEIDKAEIELKISDKLFLDVLLMKIRARTIRYATTKQKEIRENETRLVKDIETLEQSGNKTDFDLKQIDEKNRELEAIRNKRMEGVLLRSKARWIGQGEKITKYFCGLEKRNYTSKQINKLIIKHDTVIESQKDIQSEVKSFYENLYKKRDTGDCEIKDLVKNLPTLSHEEQEQMDGKITIDEAGLALKNMDNGKSPGTDGFTSEFFKFFWKDLGLFVVRSLNEAYEDGELSITQKEGLITCLPKCGKEKEYIKNWRPITLLNVVYKIGSACIANRLKNVLPKLISADQTGFMSNRYIGDNTRLLYDVMNYLNVNNLPGLLLSIDFEKAFDSLNWNFMIKVLNAYGFGDCVIRWIKTFYNNIKSSVLVNGNPTPWFSIERGCRQGDPISPYIFILCAEILAIMIKEDELIKGIQIGDTDHKITQFADDTQLLNSGDKISFERSISLLDKFGRVSGLLMNSDKTQAIWLGCKKKSNIKYCPHLHMIWNPSRFKILGIWFTQDLSECATINYNEKFSEVKILFKIWSQRIITPLGRVAVLKSVILSKLIHLWLLLPDPPDDLIQNLQNLCFQFIWNGKRDKISRKTSVKTIKQGGLNIPDIRNYICALKLSWIRRFSTTNHRWAKVAKVVYPFLQNLEQYGSEIVNKDPKTNPFWSHTFKAYKTFCSNIMPKTFDEMICEPILFNENIKIGNVMIKNTKLVENSMFLIGHYIKENGEFKSYDDVKKQPNLNIDFVTYNGWISAIKHYIRRNGITLEENKFVTKNITNAIQIIYSVTKGSKLYYEYLTKTNSDPKCCSTWSKKFNCEISWREVFQTVHMIRDTQLKWLQIRIVHRIVATNVVLHAMGVKDTSNCTWCNNTRDSIEHFLWSCQYVQNFWSKLEKLLREINNNTLNIKMSRDYIIFGVDNSFKTDSVLDFITTFAKSYIYKCKMNNSVPNLRVFQTILTRRYKIEQYNAKIENRIQKFDIEWQAYILALTEV